MATLNFSAFPDTEVLSVLASAGPQDVVECGWIAPSARDSILNAATAVALGVLPEFRLVGKSLNENATKVCLWDCWSALKGGYPGIRQVTGSCVGAGGGNALFSLAAADVAKRGDRERVAVPFWLLPYGKSREIVGLNDRGEGSLGWAFAQAVREFGHLPADLDGLPKFQSQDGLVWGQNTELDWSQGRRIPQQFLTESRKFLVKSTAKVTTPEQVRDAIKNYYPVTIASDWGGQMRPGVSNGVLLNRRVTQWNHQMSVHAWWDHPQLGELFWIQNQWGVETHGRCPSGAPGGGFWVTRNDVAYIVGQGDSFALSQFDGFPAVDTPLDFSAF